MRLLLLLQENCVDFPVHLPGYKCQTSRIITSKKRGRKKQEKQKKKGRGKQRKGNKAGDSEFFLNSFSP